MLDFQTFPNFQIKIESLFRNSNFFDDISNEFHDQTNFQLDKKWSKPLKCELSTESIFGFGEMFTKNKNKSFDQV